MLCLGSYPDGLRQGQRDPLKQAILGRVDPAQPATDTVRRTATADTSLGRWSPESRTGAVGHVSPPSRPRSLREQPVNSVAREEPGCPRLQTCLPARQFYAR
jgi:hypothetical protein